jgi:hypothetical protein
VVVLKKKIKKNRKESSVRHGVGTSHPYPWPRRPGSWPDTIITIIIITGGFSAKGKKKCRLGFAQHRCPICILCVCVFISINNYNYNYNYNYIRIAPSRAPVIIIIIIISISSINNYNNYYSYVYLVSLVEAHAALARRAALRHPRDELVLFMIL